MIESPNDAALSIARNRTATVDPLQIFADRRASVEDLESAMAAIDIPAAESEVDALEAQRRQLLAGGGNDQQVDAVEAKIRIANRKIDRLVAAREELPRRIAARKETEAALQKRAADAERRTQECVATFPEIAQHVAGLAKLLERVRSVDREVALVDTVMISDLGSRPFPTPTSPLEQLAQKLSCSTNDLRDVLVVCDRATLLMEKRNGR